MWILTSGNHETTYEWYGQKADPERYVYLVLNSLLKILLQFRTLDYQIRTPYTVMSSPLLSQNPAIPGNGFLKKLTSRQAVEMVLLLTANTQKYVSHSFR